MKKLLLIFLLLSNFCFAQTETRTPFAKTYAPIPNSWAWTNNGIIFDSFLKSPSYINNDSLKFITTTSNGLFVLRSIPKYDTINIYAKIKSDSIVLDTKINTKVGYSDTANILIGYVRKGDTSFMLNPYLRKVDTSSLSNRINEKLNYTDTNSMLNPYALDVQVSVKQNYLDTNTYDATKKNLADTSSLLRTLIAGSVSGVASVTATYPAQSSGGTNPNITVDTGSGVTQLATSGRLAKRLDSIYALIVKYTDTAAMLANYARKQLLIDTASAIQTRLNLKSNIASPTFTGTVTTPALTISGLTAGSISDSVVTINVGTGVLYRRAFPSGGSGGTPSGSSTQFQFNDGGAFGGTSGFTWDKVNSRVRLGGGTKVSDLSIISSTAFGDGNIHIESSDATVGASMILNSTAGSGRKHAILSRTSSGSLSFYDYTVGADVLGINGSQYNSLSLQGNSTAGAGISMQALSTGGSVWTLLSTANGNIIGGGKLGIFDGSAYRMVFTNSGPIGIGTSSPTTGTALDISGRLKTVQLDAGSGNTYNGSNNSIVGESCTIGAGSSYSHINGGFSHTITNGYISNISGGNSCSVNGTNNYTAATGGASIAAGTSGNSVVGGNSNQIFAGTSQGNHIVGSNGCFVDANKNNNRVFGVGVFAQSNGCLYLSDYAAIGGGYLSGSTNDQFVARFYGGYLFKTANNVTVQTIKPSGIVNTPIALMPDYADATAAMAGGLVSGDHFRTGEVLKIVP